MSIKLNELLPAPSNVSDDWTRTRNDPWFKEHKEHFGALVSKEPPPYGKRKGWSPRTPEDFGDGGAFPEIHMAQFPLGMGQDISRKGGTEKTLALQFDTEGKLRYDAIAKIGHHKDKMVYARLSDTKGGAIDEEDESFIRPDDDAVADTTEATRAALEKITNSKMDAALPVRHAEKTGPAQYIRYTPSQQAGNFNSGAEQRIIRMVEAQHDPMEPPKFKINQKIPRPPPSPPAPVLHSPSRKVTVKEQADWKIPPCISNWKNPKGYTIALDKRLAADGRGLQQVHINENFAKLAESLYIADRKAREAVEMRAQVERRVAQKKKEEQEEKMRALAQKARAERAGIRKTKDEDTEAKERDVIRKDRMDDRRRERNIARNKPEKLDRLRRDKERDISEKIALGLPDSRARTDETQFDQRLFNQTKGLDSGGIDDETYAVYDKPWRNQDNVTQHIYRPGKNLDKDIYGDDLDKIIKTNKFVPDKGFSGADPNAKRDGPVQFERSEEDDPFGLGQLLKSAKEGKKRGGGGDDRQESSSSSKRSRK